MVKDVGFATFFYCFLAMPLICCFYLGRLSGYNHISIKDVFKNIYFNQLPAQVPKSPYLFQGLKSADFFWIGFHRVVCLKKAQHNKVVCLGPV